TVGKAGQLRHRIEHVQLLQESDIKRVGNEQIIASVQPLHILGDIDLVHQHWGRRGRYAYAFRRLKDGGAMLAFGSDCPVESMAPVLGIHAAVNRLRPGSCPEEAFYPEERLTVEEAVQAYTYGPAYAANQEHVAGTLELGKLGDMVVLDQDLFTIDPLDIYKTEILLTVVAGKVVYNGDKDSKKIKN
ncbi:MAG: amidohydrolase family protein, partial [bacterium]|nr:amidohydrolase family protein [bacterium]